MDAQEKLRREIQQLSHLIASSSAGSSSSSSGQVYSSARVVNNYSIRQRPLASGPYSYYISRGVNARSQYPNPFVQLCNDTYLSQVFPENSDNAISLSERGGLGTSTSSNQKPKHSLKSVKSSEGQNGNSINNLESSLHVVTPSTIPQSRPTSVYINPSYLAKVTAGNDSLTGLPLSQAQVKVRPHVNPAHLAYQLLTTNNSATSYQLQNHAATATPSSSTIDIGLNPTTSILSTKERDNDAQRRQENIALRKVTLRNGHNGHNSPLKSVYKLDRRLKRSPSRKVTKTKVINKTHSLLKTRLVKRYSTNSMRVVSTTKHNRLLSFYYQNYAQNSVVGRFLRNKKLLFKRPRVLSSAGVKITASVKQGRKSVVSIDGSKYIRKNGGKSLKRMSSKLNVVSINGNRFIQKNGGKSLKRLSDCLTSKSKPLPGHSQQQTVGVRLANRAILKSKITLSQRIWRKKQLCVFYNRFGECKRKENGTCPYTHDRKQLMICPKFIVGKCTATDCKLSHDLKLGRMPPCQFFNKSQCSRENCPYPHIKSSPLVKKPPATAKRDKESKTTTTAVKSPTRKRKCSIKKEIVSPSTGKKKRKLKDPKARYYEQAPASQPVVSIIPRRLPKETSKESAKEAQSVKTTVIKLEPEEILTSSSSSNSILHVNDSESGAIKPVDDRRMRLMSKISKLHDRVKKKESTAPQFLPFN